MRKFGQAVLLSVMFSINLASPEEIKDLVQYMAPEEVNEHTFTIWRARCAQNLHKQLPNLNKQDTTKEIKNEKGEWIVTGGQGTRKAINALMRRTSTKEPWKEACVQDWIAFEEKWHGNQFEVKPLHPDPPLPKTL